MITIYKVGQSVVKNAKGKEETVNVVKECQAEKDQLPAMLNSGYYRDKSGAETELAKMELKTPELPKV